MLSSDSRLEHNITFAKNETWLVAYAPIKHKVKRYAQGIGSKHVLQLSDWKWLGMEEQ